MRKNQSGSSTGGASGVSNITTTNTTSVSAPAIGEESRSRMFDSDRMRQPAMEKPTRAVDFMFRYEEAMHSPSGGGGSASLAGFGRSSKFSSFSVQKSTVQALKCNLQQLHGSPI